MWITREYYEQQTDRTDTTITFTDSYDNFLLFVDNEPIGAFGSLEATKRYYEKNYKKGETK
jgi:hypothetical protein